MTPPTPDLDRCAGVLLGLAAGDALGAGYEFGPPRSRTSTGRRARRACSGAWRSGMPRDFSTAGPDTRHPTSSG